MASEIPDYLGIARQALERRRQAESKPASLETVLKGSVVELWSDLLGERLWLVADEEDAQRLGEPRGQIYTGAEARMVCRIEDKTVLREIHQWKRMFNGVAKEHKRGAQQ